MKQSSTTCSATKRVKEKVEVDVPLDDPEMERLRLRRKQEEADEAVIDDLFGNKETTREDVDDELFADDDEEEDVEIRYDITDTFDEVVIDSNNALETFAADVFTKISICPTKGAQHKFLYVLLRESTDLMKIADCEALQKSFMTVLKEKRKATAAKTLAEKKANDMTKKGAKIDVHSEMAMMYGGDDYDDEDYD